MTFSTPALLAIFWAAFALGALLIWLAARNGKTPSVTGGLMGS